MPNGTVKWFNPTKGYGFIKPEDGSKDAFVHISAVQQSGLAGLTEGQKVSYELVEGRGGMFSLENGTGKRFLVRSRLFTDDEARALGLVSHTP